MKTNFSHTRKVTLGHCDCVQGGWGGWLWHVHGVCEGKIAPCSGPRQLTWYVVAVISAVNNCKKKPVFSDHVYCRLWQKCVANTAAVCILYNLAVKDVIDLLAYWLKDFFWFLFLWVLIIFFMCVSVYCIFLCCLVCYVVPWFIWFRMIVSLNGNNSGVVHVKTVTLRQTQAVCVTLPEDDWPQAEIICMKIWW